MIAAAFGADEDFVGCGMDCDGVYFEGVMVSGTGFLPVDWLAGEEGEGY